MVEGTAEESLRLGEVPIALNDRASREPQAQPASDTGLSFACRPSLWCSRARPSHDFIDWYYLWRELADAEVARQTAPA